MAVYAISGSASGIGAATRSRLEAAGHRVIGVDVGDAEVVADLGTQDGRDAAIEGVTQASGGVLDGLVTCAGVGPLPDRPGSLLVSVNYFGTEALLDGLRPLLGRGTDPAVVAISSNSTTVAPGWPRPLADACLAGDEQLARKLADDAGAIMSYAAGKAAVAYWVRRNATQPEWVGSGIRLNAVAPGLIETPLVAEGRRDPVMGPAYDLFPLPVGRGGRADEVAGLITYLLGPDAAFFIGSVVLMDGGTEALLRPDDWPSVWVWDASSADPRD